MKGGTIRRIAGMFGVLAGLMGRPVTKHYPDPKIRDPRERRKKRAHGASSGRMSDVRPMIKRGGIKSARGGPGTIGYHDKLVSHFGRRKAEGYRFAIQLGHLRCLPTPEDFSAHPRWAFLR